MYFSSPARLVLRFIALCLLLPLLIASNFGAQTKNEPVPKSPDRVSFSRDIAPIFQHSCTKCHSSDAASGKLRLDSEAAILRGGVSGPAVVPGKSGDSILIKRILGLTDGPRMPLNGDPLSSSQVKLIQRWIDQGDFTTVEASTKTASTEKNGESTQESRFSANQSRLFAAKVRRILASRCYSCHGPDVQQNGLRLDSLAAVLKGSESGKIIVPGHSDQSRILRRLTAKERPFMPYGGPPLSNEEIDVIRQWIDAGAPGPDSSAAIPPSKPLKHWAYVKPVQPPIPEVKNARWCRNLSTISFCRNWKAAGSGHQRRPVKRRSYGVCISTSLGCRLRRKRWMRFLRTNLPTHMKSLWTGCSALPDTANAGRGSGWTLPGMQTPTATRPIGAGLPGNTGIG